MIVYHVQMRKSLEVYPQGSATVAVFSNLAASHESVHSIV